MRFGKRGASEVVEEPKKAKPVDEPAEDDEEEESFFKFFVSFLLTATFVIGALGVVAASLGSASGYYRIEIVLSGSMRPDYPPGSVVVAFTKPKEKLSPGDVIVFRSPEAYGGETITHRVLSARITESGDVYARTKGDNNSAADPWDARITSNSVWEVHKGVPYVGYVAYWSKRWWPLLVAAGVSIPMLSFATKRVKEAYADPDPVPAGPKLPVPPRSHAAPKKASTPAPASGKEKPLPTPAPARKRTLSV